MISSTEFLLKYSAAICFFTFGKRISCFLLCSTMLLNAQSASAFFSDDRIDDNFSYRSLHVEILKTKTKSKRDGCYLVGEILNNTNIVQEDVSVTFYAYDFFDHTLWKQTIHIDIMDPFYNSRKGHAFRKKLSRCDVPAKFQFKVSGLKRQDTQKAIKDKPKTKPKPRAKAKVYDSRNCLQNEDLSADIVPGSETPAVPIRKYLIILTNGKQVATDSFREQDNMVIFHQDGGEVQISKDKVAEIRTPN